MKKDSLLEQLSIPSSYVYRVCVCTYYVSIFPIINNYINRIIYIIYLNEKLFSNKM